MSRWSFTKNHYTIHGQQNIKNLAGLSHLKIKTSYML